jgi:hypothetical protein
LMKLKTVLKSGASRSRGGPRRAADSYPHSRLGKTVYITAPTACKPL